MKFINVFFINLFLLTATISCDSQDSNLSSTGIDIQTANHLISKDGSVVILDVRTAREFSKGHIEGAINIDIYNHQFTQYVAQLDRDKTYIVHCSVNPRNGRGDKSINIMRELGFKKLFSLDGGISAWQRNNLPLVE